MFFLQSFVNGMSSSSRAAFPAECSRENKLQKMVLEKEFCGPIGRRNVAFYWKCSLPSSTIKARRHPEVMKIVELYFPRYLISYIERMQLASNMRTGNICHILTRNCFSIQSMYFN